MPNWFWHKGYILHKRKVRSMWRLLCFSQSLPLIYPPLPECVGRTYLSEEFWLAQQCNHTVWESSCGEPVISLVKVQGRAKVVCFEEWFVSISGTCVFGSCARHVLNEYSAEQPAHSLLQFRSGTLLCFLVLLQKGALAQAL